MTETKVPLRGMADLSPAEKREILELALKRHTSQELIGQRYGVPRALVAIIVHQHRRTLAGPHATLQRGMMLAADPVTRRVFSWEAEA